MKEGSLDAPTRHALDWQNPDFYDDAKIEAEMERVFDICHGCRRCFNLCDSFPILFDLIDDSETGELDSVDAADYKHVVDACTLCDMCFMTKCPYVPPHEFNLDFPHLMLRHRAAELKKNGGNFAHKQLAKTDRNGKLGGSVAGLANWAVNQNNGLTRGIMESMLGIDKAAELPDFHKDSFDKRIKDGLPETNTAAPAAGQRKAVIYTTCIANYQTPDTASAAAQVLAKNGVEIDVVYPACCGMPYLEQGDIPQVVKQAEQVKAALLPYVDKGYDVIALTASCGLMLKFEWPLLMPDDEDIQKLSAATRDINQYVVEIAKTEGLVDGLTPVEGGVSVHMACHSRAQNMGPKAAEMLRFIPDTKVDVIERCSGHGGTFGIMKDTKPHADKIRKPVLNQVKRAENAHVCSDCPLACKHITQGLRETGISEQKGALHPIQLLAKSYGIEG